MNFEGITLYAVLEELRATILGGYIQKIHQPSDELLHIQIYKGEKYSLLISTGTNARIHLTTQKFENPATPTAFCMLLRKHIMGAVIESIEQPGMERLASISLSTRESAYKLELEFLGSRSNAVLVRNNKILGSIHSRVGEKSYRPGALYEAIQPSQKLDPKELKLEKFTTALDESPDESIFEALFSGIDGFGPRSLREVIARAKLSRDVLVKDLVYSQLESLHQSIGELIDLSKPAVLYFKDEKPHDCTISQYETYSEFRSEQFDSISEALDLINSGHDQEPLSAQRDRISKILKARIKKTSRVIKKSEEDLEKALNYERHKMFGDLITANLANITKGEAQVELVDFDGHAVSIQLDPKLTPVENAQAQYARYKKLKRGVEKIQARVQELSSELEYLYSLQDEMESAEVVDDLKVIENKIEIGEAFQSSQPSGSKKTAPSSGPREIDYKGYKIYVGRNSNQNDALVRQAQRHDVWMHVKDSPGSHVVIRTNRNQKVPKDVLERAAELAAFYSRAQNASKVTVTHTRVKNLKKPKGAKPGLVLVSKEDGSITVKPRGEE